MLALRPHHPQLRDWRVSGTTALSLQATEKAKTIQLTDIRLSLRQIRSVSSSSDDAVAKFKGQKGPDVRLFPAKNPFFSLVPRPAAQRPTRTTLPKLAHNKYISVNETNQLVLL